DFKCQCIATHSNFIHPRYIESVHVIGIRPHCENVEIIATLKGGREVCLEPTAPWVKLVTKAIWNK
ncbi:IL8 protein, partial [Crypturellus soui]|nr:IL8 protein [Crypturellus soui]